MQKRIEKMTDLQIINKIEKQLNIKLEQVEQTVISKSNITKNKFSLYNNENVFSLNIQNIEIGDLTLIGRLHNLKYLNLKKNKIKDISALENITQLEELCLSNNQIRNISSLKKLKKIKELDLSDNQIKDISVLGNLKKLTNLYLSENLINNISVLSNTKKITSLYLYKNQISDISVLGNLKNINAIYLENNLIKDISVFEKLNKAEYFDIDLSYNQITDISPLENLQAIEQLYLSNNKISNISALKNLKQVYRLNLSFNQINDISVFGKMKEITDLHLSHLYLTNNNISTIPIEISQIEYLDYIKIQNNPINALKFGYIISEERFTTILERLYYVYTSSYFYFIKKEKNYIFISDEEKNVKIPKEASAFVIYVFGNTTTRIETLSEIRNHIEKKILKKNLLSRFFYYNTDTKNQEAIFIDYDKLLNLYKYGENMYFDENTGRKTPVNDLFRYIQGYTPKQKTNKDWNGTQYITNVVIKDFKLFDNIKFSLSEKVNIILGFNGLGKTSILQAITIGLMQKNSYHQHKEDHFIKIKKEKSEILLHWGENEYIKRYIFENLITEEQYPLFLPQAILLSYGVNLNTQEAKYHNIIEKIILGNNKPYSISSVFRDFSNNFHDPLIVLKELAHENNTLDIIILIISTLNDFLNLINKNDKITIERHGETNFFFNDNNRKLTLQHLSEGYRDHILLITDIIIRILSSRNIVFNKNIKINKDIFGKAKGVILIDEYDRHLHPIWQRKLISKLKNVFKEIQFILTTHNILSLQAAEGNTAIILQNTNNKIVAVEKKIKYGLSIKSIYNMFFNGEDKFFASITEERLNIFYEFLSLIKTNKMYKSEEEKFISIIDKLLQSSEEVKVIVYRELRQLERQTGKTFNYG